MSTERTKYSSQVKISRVGHESVTIFHSTHKPENHIVHSWGAQLDTVGKPYTSNCSTATGAVMKLIEKLQKRIEGLEELLVDISDDNLKIP